MNVPIRRTQSMVVTGFETIIRNIDRFSGRQYQRMFEAAKEIAELLEKHAKEDHGDTPRPAKKIYPGKGRPPFLRAAGIGWGDVTGETQEETRGFVSEATQRQIVVIIRSTTTAAHFLETAMDGRWAWLEDSIKDNQDKIVQILERARVYKL